MSIKKFAAVAAALAISFIVPITAHADNPRTVSDAQTAATSKEDALRNGNVVGTYGIGVGVHISIPTASLFQCPAANCNQGYANQNWPVKDDVADLCYIPGSTTPWGGQWNLVLNQANKQVGWISTVFLQNAGGGFNNATC